MDFQPDIPSKPPEIKIEFKNLGTVPPRTTVVFEAEGDFKDGEVIDATWIPKVYTCSDCGYQTRAVAQMQDHQDHQARYHTFGQRWRRFWKLFSVNLSCLPMLTGKVKIQKSAVKHP